MFRLRHHDESTTLCFSDVAIAQNEVGLLAGNCDMDAWLTDIQMSPTLKTYRVLHNTSPIVLIDSGGHLFARLAEPTMEEPGDSFVLLHMTKNGAVFAKVIAHWASHAEKPVHLLRVAFTKDIPLCLQLFALSPLVLPASAHEIEEFMNAADEKRQLHQVMRARQRLNASLRAQVSGRPPALRNGDSFLYWRKSVVRSQSG
jgi:hypothetical protein